MPVSMKGYASPQGSIENGNRLGARPVVRQSKIYRELESGNQMKNLLGHDHLAWDSNQQQGVFQGQAVYDMVQQGYDVSPARSQFAPPPPGVQQSKGARRASFAPGTEGAVRGGGRTIARPPMQEGSYALPEEEVEYPFPGSTASCDLCGDVVSRFYHCAECREETGLFDLCTQCCGVCYLQQGPPALLMRARSLNHPTHVFSTHTMVHVTPTGG